MDNNEDPTQANYVELTAEIVSAYVAHNSVHSGDIPGLIESVHKSLTLLGRPPAPAQPERPTPAVPIKKSIGDDYIISLEDGRRYKSLKRHLTGRGLTPEQYRERWGLSPEYPMVAPSYARQRSELAKSMGLGRKRPEPEATGSSRRRAQKS